MFRCLVIFFFFSLFDFGIIRSIHFNYYLKEENYISNLFHIQHGKRDRVTLKIKRENIPESEHNFGFTFHIHFPCLHNFLPPFRFLLCLLFACAPIQIKQTIILWDLLDYSTHVFDYCLAVFSLLQAEAWNAFLLFRGDFKASMVARMTILS